MSILPPYKVVHIINESTVVTDIDANSMVAALNSKLPTFCSNWNIAPETCTYIGLNKAAPTVPGYKMYIRDTTDVSGAVAYHNILNDVPYGNVFAKTILNNNGVVLYEPTRLKPTVSQALSHEMFEMLADPHSNTWWMNINTGKLYAGEVCDPVESSPVIVRLPSSVNVTISDWVLPSWQDVQNTIGPFNHLDTLTSAFQLSSKGSTMYIKDGAVTYVFGSSVTTEGKAAFIARNRNFARVVSVKGVLAETGVTPPAETDVSNAPVTTTVAPSV